MRRRARSFFSGHRWNSMAGSSLIIAALLLPMPVRLVYDGTLPRSQWLS